MARDSSSSNTSSQRSRSISGDRLLAADPARRALAAALILEEAQQVQRHGSQVVAIGQDDHSVQADEAAVLLGAAEIERMSLTAAGRMPPEAPPGRYALNVAVRHAATELVDQLARRDPRGRQLYSGFLTRPETE